TLNRPEVAVYLGRRRFLVASTAAGGLAVLGGGIGLAGLARPTTATAGLTVPVPGDIGPATPADAGVAVRGVAPFITPNRDFYRVDTALIPPVVDPSTWRLRIHGMVDRELNLDLASLLARPSIERDITLTCVSNPVGGPYVGNARWVGIPLKALLEEAGVQTGADQIVSRSVDGFTVGTPTAIAMDGRDAILAVGMNGQPLPVEHGFPVRMLVPGLYGYVSATKWLTDLELTTFAAYDPYWVARGWKPQAPIKTMARIDSPAAFVGLATGPVVIGGVAWAQHRGIERVEVKVDDGPWTEASLAEVDTLDTWRQWSHPWIATAGRHSLTVRATDGTGTTQPEERAEPFPDGATGWHSLVVTVS
ncbi:MAG: molybdopterin-dependent oxidoreductase, partial [Candidatus Limnocylindrales bacterium]